MLRPVSRGRFMLLHKLESGFLLLRTPQGFVAVEPSSFWQRVYLLWTFRNFHQLSPLLLNPRQTALVNELFLEHAAVVSDGYDPRLEIGVVENFVPPAIAAGATPEAKTDASLAMKTKLAEEAAGYSVAPQVLPIAASAAMNADGALAMMDDVPPLPGVEEAETEGSEIERVNFPSMSVLDRSFGPRVPTPIVSWLKSCSVESSNIQAGSASIGGVEACDLHLCGAIGALSLSAYFIVQWHRIGAESESEAHISPPHLNSPDSSPAPAPAPVAVNLPPAPKAQDQPGADSETEVKTDEANTDPPPDAKTSSDAPDEAIDGQSARFEAQTSLHRQRSHRRSLQRGRQRYRKAGLAERPRVLRG